MKKMLLLLLPILFLLAFASFAKAVVISPISEDCEPGGWKMKWYHFATSADCQIWSQSHARSH